VLRENLLKFGGLLALVLSASACDEQKMEVANQTSFLANYENRFTNFVENRMHEKNYRWIFWVHFMPNDFGRDKQKAHNTTIFSDETWGAYQELHHPPFEKKLVLSEEAEFLSSDFKRSTSIILGNLGYRHLGTKKAVHAFKEIFACNQGHSAALEKILLIGTGGSHGADALQRFSLQLQETCGKTLDVAIVSDAIGQPGMLPLDSFRETSDHESCINFYQKQGFLKGNPLEGCFNIKITSETNHIKTAHIAKSVVENWLNRLEISNDHLTLNQNSIAIKMTLANLRAKKPLSEDERQRLSKSEDWEDRAVAGIAGTSTEQIIQGLLDKEWYAVFTVAQAVSEFPSEKRAEIYQYFYLNQPDYLQIHPSVFTTTLPDSNLSESDLQLLDQLLKTNTYSFEAVKKALEIGEVGIELIKQNLHNEKLVANFFDMSIPDRIKTQSFFKKGVAEIAELVWDSHPSLRERIVSMTPMMSCNSRKYFIQLGLIDRDDKVFKSTIKELKKFQGLDGRLLLRGFDLNSLPPNRREAIRDLLIRFNADER
jgi:hypothetical protein